MLILTIRSDKPEAEIGLYDNDQQLAYTIWLAHRQLSETIQNQLEALVKQKGRSLHDIKGVVAYKGPGSFTGLRIGLTVANALAYSLKVPIVSTGSSDWISLGIKALQAGQDDHLALPEYGAPPNITQPRK